MYVMIDNYDSFVYNLAVYLQELGRDVMIIRNDRVSTELLERICGEERLEGIIISPGPKSPADCGASGEIARCMAGRVPILGVCLGHQIIGHVFGARVEKGPRPMHGKVTKIKHNRRGLFRELPSEYEVTRYHSLIVCEDGFPDCLEVDARALDGTIQAISHRQFPVYGVQFHPEAVLTQYGHELLHNFVKICEEWWEEYENTGKSNRDLCTAGRAV